METCINAIKDVARHMGPSTDPWYNIGEDKKHEMQGVILDNIFDNIFEKSWEEGKGKLLAERASMCREVAQDAANLMGSNGRDVMDNVAANLQKKEEAIKSDIERWQNEGLPGRGWSTGSP